MRQMPGCRRRISGLFDTLNRADIESKLCEAHCGLEWKTVVTHSTLDILL